MAFDTAEQTAGGTIAPCRFIKQSTAANNTVLQSAGATTPIVGVSAEGTELTPLAGAAANAATVGNPCKYNPIGSCPLIEVGSGGITAGANVISDGSGKAILAVLTGTTKQYIGGIAQETASAGEFARITVQNYADYPALS